MAPDAGRLVLQPPSGSGFTNEVDLMEAIDHALGLPPAIKPAVTYAPRAGDLLITVQEREDGGRVIQFSMEEVDRRYRRSHKAF
jgi:hypothetical protein